MKLSDRLRVEASHWVGGTHTVSGPEVAKLLAEAANKIDNMMLLMVVARRKMGELQHDALADAMEKLEKEIEG